MARRRLLSPPPLPLGLDRPPELQWLRHRVRRPRSRNRRSRRQSRDSASSQLQPVSRRLKNGEIWCERRRQSTYGPLLRRSGPRSSSSRTPRRLGKLQTLGERSEEHTSELQSLMRISYAVFCLKKKKRQNKTQKSDVHNTRKSYRKH